MLWLKVFLRMKSKVSTMAWKFLWDRPSHILSRAQSHLFKVLIFFFSTIYKCKNHAKLVFYISGGKPDLPMGTTAQLTANFKAEPASSR